MFGILYTVVVLVWWFGWVSLFSGKSTFLGYLMPKSESELNSITIIQTHLLWCYSPAYKSWHHRDFPCSCLNIKKCISLVWLMVNRDIVISSLLDFLKAGFYFYSMSFIRMSLWCCYFSVIAILHGRIYWFWVSSWCMEF